MHTSLKTDILTAYFGESCITTKNVDDYLVLTDNEATKMTQDYILDSLWAFNAEYILSYTECSIELHEVTLKALKKMQQELCEDANEIVRLLLGDNIDRFVDNAIYQDGRGHFLAAYDSIEIACLQDNIQYYIYRIN